MDSSSPALALTLIICGIVAIFLLITILKTMYTVRTYSAGVVERFGKFNRVAHPGLQFLLALLRNRAHGRSAGAPGRREC